MTTSQKKEFYDIIKTYLDEKTFNNSKLLINILYGDETEFKSIINSYDFNTIFNKIWKRFVGHEKKTINVTIEERYNIYKDIIISGEKFSVPLFDNDFFIKTDNYRYDITINTIRSEIYEINGYNIITSYCISLYDFLYGGNIKLKYFNNCSIDHKFNSLVGKPLKIILKNHGLGIPNVQKNDDNEYYDMNNYTRGELIINIKIYGIDNISDIDYSNSMRDIVKHFFK
jgi:DnaJ-class molecular chaperone